MDFSAVQIHSPPLFCVQQYVLVSTFSLYDRLISVMRKCVFCIRRQCSGAQASQASAWSVWKDCRRKQAESDLADPHDLHILVEKLICKGYGTAILIYFMISYLV